MSEPDGFLSRWARRKAQVQTGVVSPELAEPLSPTARVEAAPAGLAPAGPSEGEAAKGDPAKGEAADDPAPATAPPPTLGDVALLTRESDYSRFVAPGVDSGVRNAAMKKLFTDPHFNVMDGLDTYIDDYGKPDPIPESMLRMMRQSKFLGLFDDDKHEAPDQVTRSAAVNDVPPPERPAIDTPPTATRSMAMAACEEPDDLSHEDPDLRLQQDDAAGRPGPGQGAGA